MRRLPISQNFCLLAAFAAIAFSGSAAFAQLPAGQVFADVPVTAAWYNATYTLYQLGISVGCDTTPDFCPTQDLLRQDMAAFIVRAWSARVWNDPEAFKAQTAQNSNPYFSDIGPANPQFVYVQKLYELGITSGATAPQIDGNGNLIAQGTFVPANTLHNYEIAVFVARGRTLSDNGCAAAYYNGTLKPFPVSSNANCAPNNFTTNTAPYFTDVPQSDTYFKYVQRLGDLNVYQSPSTVIGSPGCGTCVFGEQNVILRSLMAIWMVSGMGLQPEAVLTMNAPGFPGGPNGYAVQPTITVAFTFTLYNQTPASIEYGQFLLSNTSSDTLQAPLFCYGNWGQPAALALYDATPETTTGYNQSLYDGFCTVSLTSVTPITNGLQVTVNFTFNPSAAGVTYNVFHEVIYNEGQEPWRNVGTLQVLSPTPPPTISAVSPSSATPGTQVTITGANFGSTQGSSSVTFNGQVATISSWNATSIIAFVPASATSGPINVIIGGISSGGFAFQITPPPPPTISGISPNVDTQGNSGTITVTGANFSGGVISISGVSVGSTTVFNTTTLSATYSVSTSAIGSHTLTVTTPAGTDSSAFYVVPTVTITANPGIPINGTIQASVTLSSVSTSEPVLLTLQTTAETTGTATFSGGSTTQTITSSQTITLAGVTASSTEGNIQLVATPQNHTNMSLAVMPLSVVSVAISLRSGTGVELSPQDTIKPPDLNWVPGETIIPALTAGNTYPLCSVGYETVGTVTPANYSGNVELRRSILSPGIGFFWNQTELPSVEAQGPPGDDSSLAQYRIDAPYTTGGLIFDLDTPATNSGAFQRAFITDVFYYRVNFVAYAVLVPAVSTPDNPNQVIPTIDKALGTLNHYFAEGCTGPLNAPTFSDSVTGDNVAAAGQTNLTWNLQ